MKNKLLTIILITISVIFCFMTCAYTVFNAIYIGKMVASSTSNTKNYYVSKNGNDKNDGSSLKKSVRTLYKAIELIVEDEKKDKNNKTKNVNIYISKGTYYSELGKSYIINTKSMKLNNINIIGVSDSKGNKPKFMGYDKNKENYTNWFLRLLNPEKSTTKINVSNINVEYYVNGILVKNVSNSEYKNIDFFKIGDEFSKLNDMGYAAIDLYPNSSGNIIKNCTFDSLQNMEETGNHIHAVYMATKSSKNKVYNNTFINIKPDPVRVRNGSNNNKVYSNIFLNTGSYSYMSEWYNNNTGETSSSENEFYNNKLCGSWIDASSDFSTLKRFKYNKNLTNKSSTNLNAYSNTTYKISKIKLRSASGYMIGDNLADRINLKVTVSNGSKSTTLNVRSGFEVTPSKPTKIGEQTITIRYYGKTLTQKIVVTDGNKYKVNFSVHSNNKDDVTILNPATSYTSKYIIPSAIYKIKNGKKCIFKYWILQRADNNKYRIRVKSTGKNMWYRSGVDANPGPYSYVQYNPSNTISTSYPIKLYGVFDCDK